MTSIGASGVQGVGWRVYVEGFKIQIVVFL
jgi:hypothetical protein